MSSWKLGAGDISGIVISLCASRWSAVESGPKRTSPCAPRPLGGNGGRCVHFPACSLAQYPRSGTGMLARRQTLPRPTSEILSRWASFCMGSVHTSSYSSSRVNVWAICVFTPQQINAYPIAEACEQEQTLLPESYRFLPTDKRHLDAQEEAH
jgi:hypothetical protein